MFWCSVFGVCRLLVVVSWLVACWSLVVVRCLLFVVRVELRVVCCLLFVMRCVLLVACRSVFVVWHLLVRWLLFVVWLVVGCCAIFVV